MDRKWALLAGFAYSLMNLVMAPYILHPVQVLFDYPLPFMALVLQAVSLGTTWQASRPRGGTAFFPFSFGRGLFWQLRSGRHFDLSLFLCDQPDLSFAKPCNLSCLLPAPSRGALPFPHETVRGGRETILQKLFFGAKAKRI